MSTVHVSESEVARDFNQVVEKVRLGFEVVVERDQIAVAVIRSPARAGRLISDCIKEAEENAIGARPDADFARDVDAGIRSRELEWTPPTWE